jgi:hypothetical protein
MRTSCWARSIGDGCAQADAASVSATTTAPNLLFTW